MNPTLLIVVVFGGFVVLASVLRTVLKLRELKRQRKHILEERFALARICTHCGYDVRAARREGASGVCPECGTPLGNDKRI